jgi:hypothetical protein
MKTLFIRFIKYVGAFINPNDITRNSYSPYLVVKVVLKTFHAESSAHGNLILDPRSKILWLLLFHQTDLQSRVMGTCS